MFFVFGAWGWKMYQIAPYSTAINIKNLFQINGCFSFMCKKIDILV